MIRLTTLGCLVVPAFLLSVQAAPYKEKVPKFSRSTSNAMVREIAVPTLANLDMAAYSSNPVLFDPVKYAPKFSGTLPAVEQMTFGGLLVAPCGSESCMPLTALEREHPMAWRPLVKRLWEIIKNNRFSQVTSGINGFKWSDPSINGNYQEIAVAWLHKDASGWSFWVRIEFSPWVKFAKSCSDENRDGYRDLYGKLNLEGIDAATLDSAANWIQSEYMQRVLSHEEVVDWVTELASYWYPSKNTDVLESEAVWPSPSTEKNIARTMHGIVVNNPVAIVRGKPFGKPIYNIYVVPQAAPAQVDKEKQVHQDAIYTQSVDTVSSPLCIHKLNGALEREVSPYGDYQQWFKACEPFRDAQEAFNAALPEGQLGYQGKNNWLFFRGDLDYGTAGDLSLQEYDYNPVAHLAELKAYLEKQGVALLFVPVPNKTEVYFEHLPFEIQADNTAIINPGSRKILHDLAAAGVECIDLLPHFLAAKKDDASRPEPLYQLHDTHWTAYGKEIAAAAIADRVRSYAWYGGSTGKTVYAVRDTMIIRQGDIVERLPESSKAEYPPQNLRANRVYTPDGAPFKSSKDAPIILMGDSFTGVFESVDCKSAGVGAAVAAKTGIPLDILTSWGGGPLVRERLLRQRAGQFEGKKLVIYMMVARDLYKYRQKWSSLKELIPN